MAGEDKIKIVKEKYEELKKKYGLPKFDELNADFEIIKADPELNLLHELRRAVAHNLQAYAEWFEPVLNPSASSLHSMVETKIFEKEELEPLYNLYKKLWHFVHLSVWSGLQSESEEVKFLKQAWQEWPEMKKEILKYVRKLADGWQEKSKDADEGRYVS